MIKRKSQIIRVLSLLAVALVIILGVIYIRSDLSPQSSSALFGGKLESGYPYAGYSIAYQTGKVTTCGVTFVNSSTAITAAHCIPADSELYVGTGDFNIDRSANIKVNNFVVNTAWEGKPDNDIAVLNLSKNISLDKFAVVTAPQKSCNYEIVGYGQNETTVEGDFSTKLRKSIQVCIQDVLDNVAYMKGQDGGICYGDSGSPVFEKSTNRLIGIVSSIVSTSKDKSSYCALNNIGAIVLTNNFQSFILSSQFSVKDQNTTGGVCGANCASQSDCLNGLSCSGNKCLTTTSSCIASEQNFCSAALNLNCANGNSCVGNVCVNTSNITQEPVAEVLSGVNPLVIAGLLALVVFTIIVLLFIPSKKTVY